MAVLAPPLSRRLAAAAQYAIVPEQQTVMVLLADEARAGKQYREFDDLPEEIKSIVLGMEARRG